MFAHDRKRQDDMPDFKRVAIQSFFGNRLYECRVFERRSGPSQALKPGMPGWVHPAEVVRAAGSSNQLAHLSKNRVSTMTLP